MARSDLKTIGLLGDKQLERTLRELPRSVQAQVMRPALKSAMMPVKREAKRMAPHREIKRRLAVDAGVSKRVWARLTVRGNKAIGGRTIKWEGPNSHSSSGFVDFAAIAVFYEYGTGRENKNSPSDQAGIPATYWMRRSLEAKRSQALGILKTRTMEKLTAITRKADIAGRNILKKGV